MAQEEQFDHMDNELLAMLMRKFAHLIDRNLVLNRKDSVQTRRYVSKLKKILSQWNARGLDPDLDYVKWSNDILRKYEESL